MPAGGTVIKDADMALEEKHGQELEGKSVNHSGQVAFDPQKEGLRRSSRPKKANTKLKDYI